jgi:hypothetical protein
MKKLTFIALSIFVLSKVNFAHNFRVHNWLIPRGVEILQNKYPKIAKELDTTFMVGDAGVYWPDNYSTTPNWKCPSYGILAGTVAWGTVMGIACFTKYFWGQWWAAAIVGAAAGVVLYWAVFGWEFPWDGHMWNKKYIGAEGRWGHKMRWATVEHYENTSRRGGKFGIILIPPPHLPISPIPIIYPPTPAGAKCKEYFDKSCEYYKKGNFSESMKWLGRASHLIQDVTDPCHSWSPWLVLPLPFPLRMDILTAPHLYWKLYGVIACLTVGLESLQGVRYKYYERAKQFEAMVQDGTINDYLDNGVVYRDENGEVFKSIRDFVTYTVRHTEAIKDYGLAGIIRHSQRIQAGFFYYWYIKKC